MHLLANKQYDDLVDAHNIWSKRSCDQMQDLRLQIQQKQLTVQRQDMQISTLTRQVVDLQAANMEVLHLKKDVESLMESGQAYGDYVRDLAQEEIDRLRQENEALAINLFYYKGLVDIFQDIIRGESHAVDTRIGDAGSADEARAGNSGSDDQRAIPESKGRASRSRSEARASGTKRIRPTKRVSRK